MIKNLAYVYDNTYYRFQDQIFSTGSFNYKIWTRFFKGFDHITIFGTIIDVQENDIANLNRLDGPRVSFKHLDKVNNLQKLIKYNFQKDKIFSDLRNYDAVVLRVPGIISMNAFIYCYKNKIPVGLEVVGCPFDAYWNYGSFKGKILAPFEYYKLKIITNKAKFIVYVTRDFLQKRYPTKGKTINVSNVDIIVPNEGILNNKMEKLKNQTLFTIGLCGSFDVGYKGHYELLKAISIIKKEIPPFRLEIIGPGDSKWVRDLAKNLGISDHLNIIGKLKSGKDVMNWQDSLDIYVHPSKQEGLPRSVIEAMSRANPVLASSIAGVPELLNKEYLHKPGDFKKLAHHLKVFLNNREELFKMAQQNYKESKNYDDLILQNKRESFWFDFSKQFS